MGLKNARLKTSISAKEEDEYTGLNKHEKEVLRVEWNSFKANLSKHVVVLNFRLAGEIPHFKQFFGSKSTASSSLLSVDVRLQTHTTTAMNSCGLILNALIHKPELLPLYFEYLGLVHRKVGLKEEDLLGFKSALMNYLRSEFKERMTPFVDHVWSSFLNAIATNMNIEVQKYASRHDLQEEEKSLLIEKKKFWEVQEKNASIIPSARSEEGPEEMIESTSASIVPVPAQSKEESKSESPKPTRSIQASIKPTDNYGPRQDALRVALFEQLEATPTCCSFRNNNATYMGGKQAKIKNKESDVDSNEEDPITGLKVYDLYLLNDCWTQLEGHNEHGVTIFSRLLNNYPQYNKYFGRRSGTSVVSVHDLEKSKKLMTTMFNTIGLLLKSLIQQPDAVDDIIKYIAFKHHAVAIGYQDFVNYRNAFQDYFRSHFKKEMSPMIQVLWNKFTSAIIEKIVAKMEEIEAEGHHSNLVRAQEYGICRQRFWQYQKALMKYGE